jgi:hypothetical protein
MNYCLCCSGVLLQQVRGSEIGWFCRHCWQDMPVLTCNTSGLLEDALREEIPNKPKIRQKAQATSYVSQHKKITGWIGVKDVLG